MKCIYYAAYSVRNGGIGGTSLANRIQDVDSALLCSERSPHQRIITMRLQYSLGLTFTLALSSWTHAQTVPQATKPPATSTPTTNPPAVPVQPTVPTQTIPYPTPLYQMNNVSKSLNLSPEQVGRLNQLTTKTQGMYRDKYNNLSTLNDTDRWTRTQDVNRQYYGDWSKGAQEIFNSDQSKRYQQLNHQYGGFTSLYEPNVQKELNLTQQQIKSLDEHRDWNTQQLQSIDRTALTDPTKATQMYNDYWKQRQERLNTYLTPAQQRAWLQLTGEPFTFQPSFSQR
jgi:hypothetical protein